jgi:hypothetical protein
MVQKGIRLKGPSLSQATLDDLKKSGLDAADAAVMQLSETARGYRIPYLNDTDYSRERFHEPLQFAGQEKTIRYHQERGSTPELYLSRLGGHDWDEVKRNPDIPLLITEGEKKAAAACKVGIPTVGLGGVDSFSSKKRPLPQWDEFRFDGRVVGIAYDSDIVDKAQVRAAEQRLAQLLAGRGARMNRIRLPDDGHRSKVGLDDYLVANGLGRGDVAAAFESFKLLTTEPIRILPTADEAVHAFNKEYAVVNVKGQVSILQEFVDAESDFRDFHLLRLADFRLLNANRSIFGPDGKRASWSDACLTHSERREFQQLVFLPGQQLPDVYNIWQGYRLTPVAGDCSRIRQHVLEVVCCGNVEHFKYFEAWVADLLQNPASLPGVAIVTRGKEGTGKGVVMRAVLAMTAPHSVHITQGSQVAGRFNSVVKGKTFIFMDEAYWAGDKQMEGTLKGLITEPEVVIEMKGKEPFSIRNFARLAMATNNDWAVPAGPQARRFFVLNVSDKYLQNTHYFRILADHLEQGGLGAWMHHLMQLDISNVDIRKPPQTEALLEQKISSLDPIPSFVYALLLEGRNHRFEARWSQEVPTRDIYSLYNERARDIGDRRRATETQLGIQLPRLIGAKNVRMTMQDKLIHVWRFPSLGDARKKFAEYLQFPVQWPQESSGDRNPPKLR